MVTISGHLPAIGISVDGVAAAGELAALMVATGIDASRIEILDDWEVEALNRISPGALPPGSVILIELAGSPASIESELKDIEGLLEGSEILGYQVKRSPSEQRDLWDLRHKAMVGEQAMAPGKRSRSTDVCVPVGALATTLGETRQAIDELGLTAGIVAHAADGNVHVGIMLDPEDPDELKRSDLLVERLVAGALERGGTCTGEHGIGLGKIDALGLEHGDSVDLMKAIKNAFDPGGIMNPGKIFDPAT